MPSALLSLNVLHNKGTVEHYKAILTLLMANPVILVKFDSPYDIQERVFREVMGKAPVPFTMDKHFYESRLKELNFDNTQYVRGNSKSDLLSMGDDEEADGGGV